jgi:hypothetical protein
LEVNLAITILEIEDSNMAGSVWRWTFTLAGTKGNYSLSAKQENIESDPDDDELPPWEIESVVGLKRGADIHEAMSSIMDEIGYEIDSFDLQEIGEKIGEVDRVAGDQFFRGEKLLERREVYREGKSTEARARQLAPYQAKIDAYCESLSDKPLRFPGGGSYGTKSGWIRRFIEGYVLEFDCLPHGEHLINVKSGGNAYSGGKHDFGNWGETE